MKKVFKIFLGFILMLSLIFAGISTNVEGNSNINSTTKSISQENKISVTYNSHVQDRGWEEEFSKKDGQTSGTSGRSLRLEAMKIKLQNNSDINIKYQTHIQNIGWQDWKKNGEMSGTSGKSLRLEAIKIELENTEEYSIMYRVHIQNIGWQDWKTDGEVAGTTGQSLRLEAIEIKIVNKVKKGMLYIDTDIPNIIYTDKTIDISGWKMANVSNTRIEASIDGINIDEKNIKYAERMDVINAIKNYGTIVENPKPGFSFRINITNLSNGEHKLKIQMKAIDNEVIQTYTKNIKIDRNMHIQYSAHVQNIGWQGYLQDGQTAGTTGKSLRTEGIIIKGINLPKGVELKYQTHVQVEGWQDWQTEGEISGTTGKNLRLEAIRIKLEGTTQYSIMYRTHVQNIGWQEWCYDGETSGTIGESKRIEAIEIKIVPKISKNQNSIFIDSPTNQIINTKQKVIGWVMTTISDTKLKILIDDKEIDTTKLKRTERQDVLNNLKGYGDESIYNKTPGYEIEVDFSKYSLGNHSIIVQIIKDNNVIAQQKNQFTIRKNIEYSTGTYGVTGLKAAGDGRGVDLKYYKYGSGPNVFFATFAIHGFEDIWAHDGWELVQIAEDFHNKLLNSDEYNLAEKWTIYIFPGINQDGLNYGTTCNGPGRTTLYSQAPSHQGIDLNRCWQVGNTYTRYTDSRNYNGTTGFQAYEAQALRNFLLSHKSTNGQTILVDLHGWTQQVIGDSGVCSYYSKQFPENDKSSVGRYGTGYLINWARSNLGSSTKVARSALIELPNSGVTGHQSVVNKKFSDRYIEATLDMLRNMQI